MKKRILSSFLSLVLVLSLMPVSALAAEARRFGRNRPRGGRLHLHGALYRGRHKHSLPGLRREGQRRRTAANPCPRAAEKRRPSPWQMAELACYQLNRMFPI